MWAQCGQPNITSPLIAHPNIGCRKCLVMGFWHQTHVGPMWAAQYQEPTYRPSKYRKSQMSGNGLHVWAQCGQPNITSPLIAHPNIGCRKCLVMGSCHQTMWAQCGQPNITSPLNAHSNIGCPKCLVMGSDRPVDSNVAAQYHEPTYSPSKYRMSQMSGNGLLSSDPCGPNVGSPISRAHLSPIQISDVANVW